MRSGIVLAFAATAAVLGSPAYAALSPAEQRMAATVDAEQQRTLGQLERWVDQNSGTMNKDRKSVV